MELKGVVSSVFVALLLVVSAAVSPILAFFISMYSGMMIYWILRKDWDYRIPALKKVVVISGMFIVVLALESVILNSVTWNISILMETQDFIPLFSRPNLGFMILISVVFAMFPALFAYLDGLTKPDEDGLVKNPILVWIYNILSFGSYKIQWFWKIRQGLLKNDIQTVSLWWLMIPVIGNIYVYMKFSEALEKKTGRTFGVWFVLLFFAKGINILVIQAILNHDLQKSINESVDNYDTDKQ